MLSKRTSSAGARPADPSRLETVATIRDVAREAGVSVATVSRVLNDKGVVSPDTHRLVREAASRLNYSPNAAARSLITQETHTVGVLLPDLHGEFFSEVIRGIDLAARRAGRHLLVSSSHSASADLVSAMRSMRGRIDGLIVMAPETDASPAIRECAGSVPIVLLNPGEVPGDCSAISVANFEGARAVVRHLLGLGHTRIATITGPAHNHDARQRLAGYRAALAEAGIEPDARLEIAGDFLEPSGYEAADALLADTPRPTAVFAANDKMAIGVMGAMSDRGVRVPEDLAVAGFDDIETARYINPPLTTVHVDSFRLGECAVEALLGSARNAGATGHIMLPATLVVRRSCGAAHHDNENGRAHRDSGMDLRPAAR